MDAVIAAVNTAWTARNLQGNCIMLRSEMLSHRNSDNDVMMKVEVNKPRYRYSFTNGSFFQERDRVSIPHKTNIVCINPIANGPDSLIFSAML
jgi:hypothetical protein